MRLRYSFSLTLVALLLACPAAFAAKPAPELTPITGEPIESISLGAPGHTTAACNLGVAGVPAFNVNYLLPPDDAYYTLLDPAASCVCPGNSIQLNSAHVVLTFPVVCTVPVRIRIVPAINAGTGCYYPDINTSLCGPISYNLTVPAAGTYQFNLPLPTGCCINGPVFLDVNFIPAPTCNTSSTRPRLVTTDTCNDCVSWNVYPGGFDDLCFDIGFPGNPIMFADGDCCQITPTVPNSWGRVKMLYR